MGMREMTRFACSHERGWMKDMKKLMRSGRCPCILETPFIASVDGFSKLIIDAALGLIIAAVTPFINCSIKLMHHEIVDLKLLC